MASKRKPATMTTATAIHIPSLPPGNAQRNSPPVYTTSQGIIGALMYACASILIIMVNKVALYVWKFPSVATLALAQFVFSVVSLRLLKALNVISFPDPSMPALKAVFPLPLLYVGNALSGLSGTKALSLPMFTVLRRTNMLITMALEYWLLGTTYGFKIKASIALMLFGSILATMLDVQFDLMGYAATMLNNVFTSVGGVVTKLKLNSAEREDDKAALSSMWGLMYMNSLVGTPLLLAALLALYPESLRAAYEFEHWSSPQFVMLFLCSSAMGTVLQFSIFYCTKVNSALTTVVTGVLKNVLTSYVGMWDARLGYTFHWLNFIGINVSMFGGIWYAYIQFIEGAAKSSSRALPVAAAQQQPGEAGNDEERAQMLGDSSYQEESKIIDKA